MTDPAPEQSGIPAEDGSTSKLLRDLRIEFGPRCNRTVEFIQSAHWVLHLEPHDDLPRQGEIVAYCLREAVDTLKTALDGDSRLGEESMKRYVRFYRQASSDLHGELSHQKAAGLYADIILFLRQQFHRREDLERLARVISPCLADVEEACQLIGNPAQLKFFLDEAGIEWLDPLTENGFLDPTDANRRVPLLHVVHRFGSTHPERVAEWLRDRWEAMKPDQAETVVCAALGLEGYGIQLILDILSENGSDPEVIRIAKRALVDPSREQVCKLAEEQVCKLADYLLRFLSSKYRVNPQASLDLTHRDYKMMHDVIKALIGGMNAGNAERRIQLIGRWLAAVPSDNPQVQVICFLRPRTVADYADVKEREFVQALVGAWIQAVRVAKQWVRTDCLMGTLEDVPETLAARMRAWLLSTSDDISEKRLIAEVAESINCRLPTGDDLLLVERVERGVREAEVLSPWREALGIAPSISKIDGVLAANDVPERWHRAHEWRAILSAGVTDRWRSASEHLAAECGELDRAAYRERPGADIAVWVGSPIDQMELESRPPVEASAMVAAWRPKPGDWEVSFHGLGQTLRTVVGNNPEEWARSPAEVVTALHHPRYITEYFAGLATALRSKSVSVPAGKLVEVIAGVKTGPWPFTPLGGDAPYNTGRRETVRAGIELLQAFADRDVGYEDKYDEAWTIVSEEARQRDEPASSTRALQAVLSFMKYEYRAAKKVRPEALALLDEALRLDGSDGLHRAILARSVGFLHGIAREWMEERGQRLFGSEAPDDIGQSTLELVLKYWPADSWVLEKFRSQHQKAVEKGAPHAMTKLVYGMLTDVPEYSRTQVLSFLNNKKVKDGISNAASELGQLLRNNENKKYLSAALEFWEAAIECHKANMKGFGWMAVVGNVDDQEWSKKWSELTLRTLERTKGAIDCAEEVAERVSALPPDPTRLRIMDFLVRNADPWSEDLINDINEKAVDLFRRATDLEGTDEYRRLQTALLERGVQIDDQ